MNGSELRQAYLHFWKERGHAVVSSASLVPDGDPTTLFTGSGMQPMLPYLLGERHPQGVRVADSQRCIRVQDIEEVGDNRHTTVFEMLGNWSLGDYFKAEQLPWLWQFLTEQVGLEPERLYVSVFGGNEVLPRDEEAIAIWQRLFSEAGLASKVVDDAAVRGMQDGRIFSYGDKKNWWSRSGVPAAMPVGEPGGPDSEMFYEFTEVAHDPAFGAHCHVNCDCGRFLEIGNSVFMQYRKEAAGFSQLPQRNIDFGGGLERLLAAKQQTSDVFKTDLFWPIVVELEGLSGRRYDEETKPFRVIADHLKAAVWLASDGVVPSNKLQGYVMRRLIRRAIGQARYLGITESFTSQVVTAVAAIYGEAYPAVLDKAIVTVIAEEEAQFSRTVIVGSREAERRAGQLVAVWDGSSDIDDLTLDGTSAAAVGFDIYQTHGLPGDMFLDIYVRALRAAGWGGDELVLSGTYGRAFDEQLVAHQALSRSGSAGMFKGGLGSTGEQEVRLHTATHLLQQALRDVLGDTVIQRGSNITAERLRFDFTAEARPTVEQRAVVERIVNERISADLPVSFTVLPQAEAVVTGAIHAFGEKYGDQVKVYSIGPLPDGEVQAADDGFVEASEVQGMRPRSEVYSREFCGGPHVARTGMLGGPFKLGKDEKIARDVVRIKATLG